MFRIKINGNEVDVAPPLSGPHHAALHFAPLADAEIPETPATSATNYFLIQTKEAVHAAEKT